MGICFGLFIVPALVAQVIGFPVVAGQLVGLLLGGVANALAIIIPLGIVEKHVPMLAEN